MKKTDRLWTALLLGSFLIVPGISSAATTTDAAKVSGETTVPSTEAPEPQPSKSARKSDAGMIGMGIRASTLGAGAEAAVSLTNRLNLRGGVNIFQYNRGFDHDGVSYKGQLNLRSGEAHLDWYPLGHAFHLSPGLLVYNGNGATATASVPGGSTFTLGGQSYTSDPANPITGMGKLDFMKVAPTAMFGFGNLVPEHRHITYNFELGAVFQGSARTKLNLAGSACPNGINCVDASTDPTVLANIAAEQTKINNKLSPFKYFPVVSMGFGYRF